MLDGFGGAMTIKNKKTDQSSVARQSQEDQLIIDLFALLLEWHIEDQKPKDIKNDFSGKK